MSGSRTFLDHNATTPVDPRVLAAMEPYWREHFGNPSSTDHEHGRRASTAVEEAREKVAKSIGARANEIVFTGSCTEANNMAIVGAARAIGEPRHLITTSVEHPAVIEPAKALQKQGWSVTFLSVDSTGQVSPEAVMAACQDDTALVSVMAANNEVGTLQPIAAIGGLCAARGILFHSDLAQVIGSVAIDVARDNIHLASLSAHKAYGPKGVGALYIRSRSPRARVAPLMFGGGQERSLRPGTVSTPLVVGMGEAFEIATKLQLAETKRARSLCNMIAERILSCPGSVLNGHPTERLPHNLSFSIDGVEPLALIRRLNDRLSFSASSACASGRVETSHVLMAMFGDVPRARQAFRVAVGRSTTEVEAAQAADMIVAEARRLLNLPAATS